MRVAAILLASIALGVAAGLLVPRREPVRAEVSFEIPATRPAEVTRPPPPTAPPPIPPGLREELEELRENPATFTPEEKSARAAELWAKAQLLEKEGNERDLMTTLHGLAALGSEGYAHAFEVLAFLENSRAGGGEDWLLDSCDGAVLRMAMWAISDPAGTPERSRQLCAKILSRHFDDNLAVAPLILRALASEPDPEVRRILAGTLPLALPVARVPVMASVGGESGGDEEAALALARGIAAASWPNAERDRVLAWLEISPDTATSEAARLGRTALHPPVAGVLLDRVEAAAAGGLQKGDILVSIDGRPMGDIEDVHRALSGAGNVRARIRRGPQEFDLGTAAVPDPGSIDGFFVEPK